MKKLLTVLLWSVLLLCFYSCGSKTDNEADISEISSASSENITDITEQAQNKLLFENNREGIYNYCPSVIELPNKTRYVYYCTNKNSFEITDYVGCRKGTPDLNGGYSWGEESLVLAPSDGAWDARHTCDPSVIAGSFSYKEEEFSYLMAYLGCTSSDNQENKIGLAVAKSPEGPFVKVGTHPFTDFQMDEKADKSVFQWGVGQASLINCDEQGRVWMFYTRGDKNGTNTFVEIWDLSNLDNPVNIKPATPISIEGLVNMNGTADIINNADFVYDESNQIFYAASDCHPNPTDEPNYIVSAFRVNSFKFEGDFTKIRWTDVCHAGEAETGFARNHNVGLVRNQFGYLADKSKITVYYTMSIRGQESLWSYRLHEYSIEI